MPTPESLSPFEQPEAQTEPLKKPNDYSRLLDRMEKGFDATKSAAAQEAFAAEPKLHRIYEMRRLVGLIQKLYIFYLEMALAHAIDDAEKNSTTLMEVRTETMMAPPTQIFLQSFEKRFGKIEFPPDKESNKSPDDDSESADTSWIPTEL